MRTFRDRTSLLLVVTLAWRRYRQTLPSLGATSVNYLTPSLGRHSLAETVGCFAALLTGLICAFHNPYYLTTRHLSDSANVIFGV